MRVATVIVAGVLAVALLWIGAELHYRGCVQAAEARTLPAGTPQPRAQRFPKGWTPYAPLVRHEDRRRAVGGCSRLPF